MINPWFRLTDFKEGVTMHRVYSRYLQHATQSELINLQHEIQQVLENYPPIPVHQMNDKLFTQMGDALTGEEYLYRDTKTNSLKTWKTGTRGPTPINLIPRTGDQHRAFSDHVPEFQHSNLNGYVKITQRNSTKKLLALIGAIIICYKRPISDLVALTGYRVETCQELIQQLHDNFGVIIETKDRLVINELGDMLTDDPIPYLKLAFPNRVLVKNKQLFQVW